MMLSCRFCISFLSFLSCSTLIAVMVAADYPKGVTQYNYTEQASDTRIFIDSLGVNTHINYGGTCNTNNYSVWTEAALEARLYHLRVTMDATNAVDQLINLGGLGFKMTILCDLYATPSKLQSMIKEVNSWFTDQGREPVIVAVEGPNEPDGFWGSKTYKGKPYPDGPVLYQQDLYTAMKSDSATSWITVQSIALGLAANNPGGPWAPNTFVNTTDVGNFHPYPFGGNPWSQHWDYANITWYYNNQGSPSVNLDEFPHAINNNAILTGSLPMMSTESGYSSSIYYDKLGYPTYDYQSHAIYIPRLYMEYFRLNIRRLLSYDLCDENSASQGNDFGLLDDKARPKPAYNALYSFMQIIGDILPPYPKAAWSTNINPLGPYTLYNQDTFNVSFTMDVPIIKTSYGIYDRTYLLHHTILQRTDQVLYLIYWHEIGVLDLTNRSTIDGLRPQSHPAIPVNITLHSITTQQGQNIDINRLTLNLWSYDTDTWNMYMTSLDYNKIAHTFSIDIQPWICVVQITPMATAAADPATKSSILNNNRNSAHKNKHRHRNREEE